LAQRPDAPEVEFVSLGVGATDLERYGDIRLADGAVIVYDVDDENAWIQSPSGIKVTAMR